MATLVYEEIGDHEALALLPEPTSDEPRPRPRTLRLERFALEGGGELDGLALRYETYGALSPARDNAVVVFHALTGSAHAAGVYDEATLAGLSPYERAFGARGWWSGAVGPGRALDTDRYFVVSMNVPGSCYGSSGPHEDPGFPQLSIRDMVRAQAELLERLGVPSARVVGGSMGGMLALEFALSFPERTQAVAVFAAPPRQTAWARGWQHLQREAVRRGDLALGRALSMLSYRHPAGFAQRWDDEPEQAERYLDHQGAKFTRRFSAASYALLTRAMDGHDVGRGRGGVAAALAGLDAPALFVGIDTDLLYPADELRRAAALARAEYAELTSPHGHDGFLIESGQVNRVLRAFGF
ncbi:homoserine O-acetyltransferase [Oceanithermus sp.]|uniref:homoserine O-acetyltransferase family protein n=1 Tax=Oceanithermus sp. TaxID=2268145 RepID=UPI0025EC15C5|nr:homoserine O-acetyltransferase [Oceanithermus sp.]